MYIEKDIANFDRKALIKEAMDVLPNAYAPYSHFFVGAAVLMSSGKVFTGVNVENASYPAGICAERNAIFSAVSVGEKHIEAIAIVGGFDGKVTDFAPPCGICRQVMTEFGDLQKTKVILAVSEDEYKELYLEEILPFSFGPQNLSYSSRQIP